MQRKLQGYVTESVPVPRNGINKKKLVAIPHWVYKIFTSNGNSIADVLDLDKLKINLNDTDFIMCGSLNKLKLFEGMETLISIHPYAEVKRQDKMSCIYVNDVAELLSKSTYYSKSVATDILLNDGNKKLPFEDRIGFDIVDINDEYVGMILYDTFFTILPPAGDLVYTIATKVIKKYGYSMIASLLTFKMLDVYFAHLKRTFSGITP